MPEDYKDTPFLRALGKIVKQQRQRMGASQEQLAERAGLHRTYVSDIERGLRNLTVSSANRIASGLRVPVSFLIAETERFMAETPEEQSPVNGFR